MTLEVRSSVWKKGKRLIQNCDKLIVFRFSDFKLYTVVLIPMFHLLLLIDVYVFNINSVGYGFGS